MNGEIAIEYIHVHVVGRMHFQCIYMCVFMSGLLALTLQL